MTDIIIKRKVFNILGSIGIVELVPLFRVKGIENIQLFCKT